MSADNRLENKWNDAQSSGRSEPELLLYRSRLLGSDRRITNYGGGNTSAKVRTTDPLTQAPVDVLWVKGSGGDLGSIGLDGFATLYLDKLAALPRLYRGREHEDEMAGLFAHCAFNLNPRATSIDTPPHAFIPHAHVDHMHADALIALAAARDGERLTREVLRGRHRLGALAAAGVRPGPEGGRPGAGAAGALWAWSWAGTVCSPGARPRRSATRRRSGWCSARRPGWRRRAARNRSDASPRRPFPRASATRSSTRIAPVLRGRLSAQRRKVLHYVATPEVMEFVDSERAAELAPLGTTCPDHFLRTRVRPLFVPFAPERESAADLLARALPLLDAYRDEYAAYYARCRRADSPAMRDPYPVVLLVPGVGLLTFQTNKATARIAAEYYVNTINVMRGAEGVDTYAPMPEQEAFDIEYWTLEEAKLQRLPPPAALEGRVALVTGAAGGIGGAITRRLLGRARAW